VKKVLRMTLISWLFKKCGVNCNRNSVEDSQRISFNDDSNDSEIKIMRRQLIKQAVHDQVASLQKEISELIASGRDASVLDIYGLTASDLEPVESDESELNEQLWLEKNSNLVERTIRLRMAICKLTKTPNKL